MKLLPLVQMWGRRLTAQGAVWTSQLSRGRLREGEKSSGNWTKGSVLPWKASASDCSHFQGFALLARWVRQSSVPGWAGMCFRTHQGTSSPLCVPAPRGAVPVWDHGWAADRAGRLGNGPRDCQHPHFYSILFTFYLYFYFYGDFYWNTFLSALIFSWTQDFQFTSSVLRWNPEVVWKAWLRVFPVGHAVPSPLVTEIHIPLTCFLSIFFYFYFFKVCWTLGVFAKHEQSDELGSFPDKTLLSWKTSKLLSWFNNNFSRLGQPSGMERVGGCCKFTGNCSSYVLTLPLQQIART